MRLVLRALLVLGGTALLAGSSSGLSGKPARQPEAQAGAAPLEARSRGAAAAFPPALLDTLKKIERAVLEDGYAYRQLAHLTDNIGPRLSGSPQAAAAVDYVAGELRRLGLDVGLEKVMVPHWVRGTETGELVEYQGQVPGTVQKIVLTALGGSVATPAEGITAPVVVADSFEQLVALGRDSVAGKIVLFNERFDKEMAAAGYAGAAYGRAVRYRGRGAQRASALGAVAALVRSVGGADYRLPHTGMEYPAEIPAAAVAAEDADLIARLTREGPVRMHLTLTPQALPDVLSYNVIADLKGTEHPEQVVIVSGHLDSWDLGTGAIDDGAGVAVAMETAQVLQQLHLRPKRTIRVIAWMNEENGARGSQAYALDHRAELGNHVGAVESDFGADYPLGFTASVDSQALSLLAPISDVLEDIGATLIRRVDTGSTGTDIAPLSEAGVPSFGLMQDGRIYFNYHHTAADTLDKVDPRGLAENAAVMAVLAYALAEMPEPLPHP